jgi:hypothetical protein
MRFSLLLLSLLCSLTWAEDAVYFSDPNLKNAVEEALWVTDPTPTDMLALTDLTCTGTWDLKHAIASLTGLEYATNLQSLTLGYHLISNLSPLSGLSNLQTLTLSDNEISDISELSALSSLRTLDLESNQISDISVLSLLSNLETLNLHRNLVSDISPLLGLTSLRSLDLRVNPLNQEAYDTHIAQIRANNPAISLVHDPSFYRYVTIESTVGGSVTQPGEGTFDYEFGEIVEVVAKPDPCFAFAGWSGSYYGTENPLDFFMDQDYTICANFLSLRDTLYVDDDAPDDPGPRDLKKSDPSEIGTLAHPFDSIQEAIRFASQGATILVHPGTYRENIDLLGKNLQLIGMDPNDPNRTSWPVIEGTGAGPVVRFECGEGPKCLLMGFVITGGKSLPAGAILCDGAGPTLTHCLIVGNRSTDPDGAIVYCEDSQAVLTNCTIADNYAGTQGATLMLLDSNVTVLDSILWNTGLYEVLAAGTSEPDIRYCGVRGWWPDWGNIHKDPLFARPGVWVNPEDPDQPLGPENPQAILIHGDYHLKSQAGRWDPETQRWVEDEATSPCIDAGLATSPVGDEPTPNGNRINMGAYGGTTHASKSHFLPDSQ